MSFELGIVLALLASAIVMFAIGKPRMDAVALLMLTALPLTGVLSMNEALAGFSDGNIVLIAALFVVGDGLVRTGIARRLGDWLTNTAGSDEGRLIVLLMVVVCGLGATMSSTAVTAIFIPVVLRISQRTGTSPSRLLMPLSAAALISGMTTLVATAPNLVVNSELVSFLERQGNEDTTGFQFFSFTPFGLPILVLGIMYMLVARRWLSGDALRSHSRSSAPSLLDWVEEYRLTDREHRVRVQAGSALIGPTLEDLRLRNETGATLVAVQRGATLVQPTGQTRLQAGDILLLDFFADEGEAETLRQKYGLEELPLSGAYFADRSQEIGMAEVILPASSQWLGQTVADSRLRDRTGLTVIGLRRGQTAHERTLRSEQLKLGDTLLLIGPWRALEAVPEGGKDMVLLNLPVERAEVLPAADKAPQALACLALVVGLMISGVIPNVQAALIGCLLMGALGCVNLTSAYRAIDWKTLVLIVGMLPFSIALQRTGGVDLASDALMAATSGAGTYAIFAALFAITATLGMFISNTATAVLMAPVALAVAEDLDASPYPFAMIVALAASTAFMTPVSSPVNTLVVGPGNYTFGDFVRVGVPFSLVVMVVCVIFVPWLLPL
jgi:di/tricarboxylate transporter